MCGERREVFGVAGVGGEGGEDGGVVAAAGAEEKHLPLAPRLLGDSEFIAAFGACREPLVRVFGVAAVGAGPLAQGVEQLVDDADLWLAPVHFDGGGPDTRSLLGRKRAH